MESYFPIGFGQLFRGELLNFGGGGYASIFLVQDQEQAFCELKLSTWRDDSSKFSNKNLKRRWFRLGETSKSPRPERLWMPTSLRLASLRIRDWGHIFSQQITFIWLKYNQQEMVVLEYIRSIGIQSDHDQIYTSKYTLPICLFVPFPSQKKHGSRQGLCLSSRTSPQRPRLCRFGLWKALHQWGVSGETSATTSTRKNREISIPTTVWRKTEKQKQRPRKRDMEFEGRKPKISKQKIWP